MKINCMNAEKNMDAMNLVSKFDDILEQAESKETETYIESCKKLFENLSESTDPVNISKIRFALVCMRNTRNSIYEECASDKKQINRLDDLLDDIVESLSDNYYYICTSPIKGDH